jgi:hypothetical protein
MLKELTVGFVLFKKKKHTLLFSVGFKTRSIARFGEWLAFLLRIREVSGSTLLPEIGYPEGCRGFRQSLPLNARV